MELISINVSLPSDIEYEGKIISTGIFKKPVECPVYVSRENLAGDRQVDLINHGGEHKAVYAFSCDHYPYWRNVLGKPDMNYGQIGENLTISGFDESTLHIGDQLQVGGCLLEITQPRVPCFKLGIAVGNKKMPRLFVQHFATGIYLRVLQEGVIETGHTVELVSPGKHQLSVKNLFRSYYDKHFSGARQVLETALDIPELSQEWRGKVLMRLEKDLNRIS